MRQNPSSGEAPANMFNFNYLFNRTVKGIGNHPALNRKSSECKPPDFKKSAQSKATKFN